MDQWLGKHWLLRFVLLLFASGLSFFGWPWGLSKGPEIRFPRRTDGAVHLSPSGICPLILQDRQRGLYAWDWKTGRRWLISKTPNYGLLCPLCVDGRTEKVAYRVDGLPPAIVIANVAPGGGQQIYALNSDMVPWELITVSSSGKFAAIVDFRRSLGTVSLQIIDLAANKIVDTKTIWGAVAVVAGGDELEAMVAPASSSTPASGSAGIASRIDVGSLRQVRWRIDDEGHLVPSEHKPMITPFAYRPVLASFSPDGRYEAGIDTGGFVPSRSERLILRDRALGTILDCPPQAADSRDFVFSSDSKYFFFTDANGVDHVYDLATSSIVASYDDGASTRRFVWGLFLTGIALGLTSLVLALRQSSFEIAGFYYVLAVACFDSASIGLTLWMKKDVLFVASYGCLVALGAYWACRDRTFWARFGLGLVAFAIVSSITSFVAWRNTPSPFNVTPYSQLDLWVYAGLFVIVTSAIPACVTSTLSGWTTTRTSTPTAGRRFQFGISSLMVTTLLVGFLLAPIPLFVGTPIRLNAIAGLAFVGVIALFANGVLVTLLTWLWFRQWSVRSLMVLASIAVAIALAVSLHFIVSGNLVAEKLRWGAVSLLVVLYQLAAFSFPMYLARRHGFRWAKAGRTSPAQIPPETSALPAEASLSPGHQPN